MHNSLKYFRAANKEILFAQMEAFMKSETLAGKSISIEHDGSTVVALLGYTEGNTEGLHYHTVVKTVCKKWETDEDVQKAINKTADEMGSFICQSTFIENDDLSVVFLTCI